MKSKRQILFIVEGEETEASFIGSIGHKLLKLNKGDYTIFSFNTSIYELYEAYKNGEYDYVVDYLVSEKNLEISKDLTPKDAFSAIYLVFDFDFNYQKYTDEIIRELLEIFNNETENGKLYINYPMFESYYHLKQIPDYDYINRTIETKNCYSSTYKTLVKSEGINQSRNVSRLTCFHVIKHNYDKAKYICRMKSLNYIDLNYELILDKQIEKKNNEYCIFVLNTFVLFIIDYNPDLIKVIENAI